MMNTKMIFLRKIKERTRKRGDWWDRKIYVSLTSSYHHSGNFIAHFSSPLQNLPKFHFLASRWWHVWANIKSDDIPSADLQMVVAVLTREVIFPFEQRALSVPTDKVEVIFHRRKLERVVTELGSNLQKNKIKHKYDTYTCLFFCCWST